MEIKRNPIEACELKFNDDEWRVEGYASVFNSVDKVGDTILPGAFAKTIEERSFGMQMEHLRWVTPGKWDSAVEDEKGLRVVGHLTRDHSVAKDLRASMRHGTIKGLSIGFSIPQGGYEERDDGGRDISEIKLFEVSFTANPAEPKATIESFKSELEAVQDIREFENFLRDAGRFSRSMAKLTIGKAKTLVQCDAESERKAVEQELKALCSKSIDLQTLLKR